MDKRTKLLIGYDGSDFSEAAIDDLKYAGLPSSVDALVLSVADVFLPPPITDADEIFPMQVPHGVRLAHERAERAIKVASELALLAAERLKSNFPDWRIEHAALADSPAWALIRKAEEQKSDLVIVGAQGHSFLGGRLILGSVSQRVLYEAGCSVRIARRRKSNGNKPLRILVGIDNSKFSDAAIKAIIQRQWPAGTEVRLLTAVDTVMLITSSATEPPVMKWIEVGDEENWDEVRQIFQSSVDELRAVGLDAALMIRRGNPKTEIIEEAESWDADCIFVGAKGVRGSDRLLLGSVSSAVSARAHCSVEVVRIPAAT